MVVQIAKILFIMPNFITKTKRVRENTSPETNLKIDEKTLENITHYFGRSKEEITDRIKELDNEWDIEQVLELSMSAVGLAGISLSLSKNKTWLAVPTIMLGFFAQHSLQGWCPPVTLFRSLKIRTRDEIDQEKHALKALRGDYTELRSAQEAFVSAIKDES
jgi:hypothetical protein